MHRLVGERHAEESDSLAHEGSHRIDAEVASGDGSLHGVGYNHGMAGRLDDNNRHQDSPDGKESENGQSGGWLGRSLVAAAGLAKVCGLDGRYERQLHSER